ncbi:MAG: hypothetical protein ABIE07_06985 [Candidatus Zixiibacteriota bacterium]
MRKDIFESLKDNDDEILMKMFGENRTDFTSEAKSVAMEILISRGYSQSDIEGQRIVKSQLSDASESQAIYYGEAKEKLRGIKGWLKLLLLNISFILFMHIALLMEFMHQRAWEMVVLYSILTIFSLIVLVAGILTDKNFPRFAVALYIIVSLEAVLAMLFSKPVEYMFLWIIVESIPWVVYVMVSQRVKLTYVEKKIKN